MRCKPYAEFRIVVQLHDRALQARQIALLDEQARFAVPARLARAVHIVRDRAHAAKKRLRHGPGQPLAVARVRQDVHRPDQPGHPRRRHEPGQHDLAAHTQSLRLGDQPILPPPVAHPEQLPTRVLPQILGQRIEQIIVPLVLRKPRDRADDEVVLAEPEMLAYDGARLVVLGFEIRIGLHAAAHGDVLLGSADAASQELLGHRVGDADNCVAALSSEFLGDLVDFVLHAYLRV